MSHPNGSTIEAEFVHSAKDRWDATVEYATKHNIHLYGDLISFGWTFDTSIKHRTAEKVGHQLQCWKRS